jgi:hypothetical protein
MTQKLALAIEGRYPEDIPLLGATRLLTHCTTGTLWTISMLTQRGQAFLDQHKRRRYAADLEFLERLLTQIGLLPVQQMLEFQTAFGGFVSPSRSGPRVWGLATSRIPELIDNDGVQLTPCTDDLVNGPRIDAQGNIYANASSRRPIASSCFLLFEQLALIFEWETTQHSTSQSLVAACNNVDQFHQTVLPTINDLLIDALSDDYSRLYVSEAFVIRAHDDGATAWFVQGRLPDGHLEAFGESRPTQCAPFGRKVRFADRLRSLFCDPVHCMIY